MFMASCEIGEVKRQLYMNVKLTRKATDFRATYFLKAETIGNVDGDYFWLQHTRPHLLNFPQRYFKGKMISAGSSTKLEGGFQYTDFYKLSVLVIVIGVSLISVSIHSGVPMLFALPALLVPAFSPIVFREDEAIIINLLEDICRRRGDG